MAQAQGSQAQLVIMPEDVFNTKPVLSIHTCEAAWDELVDADVTATADATYFKQGAKSCKLAVAVGCGAGDILATDSFAAKDLSTYTKIGMWVRSSVTLASGDLQLLLDNTASCASPLESLDIPAITVANTWTYVKMTLAAAVSDTAIVSVGIKMVVDKGEFDFYVDNIEALNAVGQIVPIISESIQQSRALNQSKVITSDRNPKKPTRGNLTIGGDVPTELNAFMTTMMKHHFGGVSTEDLTGKYKHLFTIGTLPVGLSIEKQFTDLPAYILMTGCKVNKLKVGCKESGAIDLNFNIIGAQEQTVTTDVSSLDSDPTDWGHDPFDAFEATLLEGGSTIATVYELEFEGDNDVKGKPTIGSLGVVSSLNAGTYILQGTLKAMFDSATLYNKAINDTETSLKLTLTKGTGDGTAGNEKVIFEIQELVYEPKTPAIAGPEGVEVELAFKGYYINGSNASAIRAEFYNTQASVI